MIRLWSTLATLYSRWRFVEDVESPSRRRTVSTATETPEQELKRLQRALAREEDHRATFRKYQCGALAHDAEVSLRDLVTRIHALELRVYRAV